LEEGSTIPEESNITNQTPVEDNTEIEVTNAKGHPPEDEKQIENIATDIYYKFDPR
jgi:hypothetical protein